MSGNKRFNRNIDSIKKFSNPEGDFWKLLDFGKMYYGYKEKKFMRELFLVRGKEAIYKLDNWDLSKVQIVGIPEEKTNWYIFGTIFNEKGYPIKYPAKELKDIQKYDGVLISNNKNYFSNGNDEFFKDTIYESLRLEYPTLFRNRPYFKYINKYDNNTEVYIPCILIAKRFYYKSFTLIDAIINKKIFDGILDNNEIDGNHYVTFSSRYIDSESAKFLSKYIFTYFENGFKTLKLNVSSYYKEILSSDKLKTHPDSEINYLLPFSIVLKTEVIGQYIHKLSSQTKKFLVYALGNIEPYGQKYDFFKVKEFEMIDLVDKRSLESSDPIEKRYGKKLKMNEQLNTDKIKTIFDDVITNNQIPKEELKFPGNIFDESPVVRIKNKEDQDYKYVCDQIINIDNLGNGLNSNDTNSNSGYRQTNETILSEINSFDVLRKALEIIDQIENITVEYITILGSNYFPHSVISSLSDERSSLRSYEILTIAKITTTDNEYCLFDAGSGFHIGMVCNIGFPIQSENDLNITNFMKFMMGKPQCKWSDVYFNGDTNKKSNQQYYIDIAQRFNFKVLQPLEHRFFEEEEECVLNLTNRILKRLKI